MVQYGLKGSHWTQKSYVGHRDAHLDQLGLRGGQMCQLRLQKELHGSPKSSDGLLEASGRSKEQI